MKSVVVMANKRVDASSVSESGDQLFEPSVDIDSKQHTIEQSRSLNL